MGLYTEHVLPRLTDVALGRGEIARLRRRATAGLAGEVLEIGFGSGLNVAHYPPRVRRVRAVEPSATARRLAARRIAASAIPVDYVGLDGQELALEDASVDHALTTWTLCTIPDAERALSEVRRVLRPGGSLHFLEHGLAPDASAARWQARLGPLQRRLAGGCHLDRPIDRLVAGAGLHLDRLDRYYLPGPRPFGAMYEGTATKPVPHPPAGT